MFEDGEFSATDLDNPPLLTINAPIGLGFRDNPGDIVNRSVVNNLGLQISLGESITLVGGNVDLEGGSIFAPGGRVELGGLKVAGEVNFNENGSLNFPEGIERADVSLSQQAAINVRADGGGFIGINAKNLVLSDQSELFAGIAENSGSPQAQAGDIIINATESVTINGEPSTNEFESLEQLTTERDNAAGIRNNVGLYAVRRNDGSPRSNALGNGGNIVINTGTLELTDVAVIDTSILGEGKAGNININADTVLWNGGVLLTQVRGFELENIPEQARGDAGDVNINTGSFILNDRSGILADVQEGSIGNGGDININASREVALNEDNLLLTQLGEDAKGSAGDIKITANSLTLRQSSLLLSDVQPGGEGDGGNITLDIQNNISLDGNSQILTQVQQNGFGNGGDITISTGSLTATGSFIQANSSGIGNSGNITINADEQIVFENALLNAQLDPDAIGNAGMIKVNSNSLSLENSQFSTQTSSGDGGNIDLQVNDTIRLENASMISAEASGNANGGNIDIDTTFIIASPNQNNDIIASAEEGIGGRITIDTEDIFGLQVRPQSDRTNDIDASGGVDGQVTINNPNVDITRGLVEVPQNVVEPEQTVAQACRRDSSTGKVSGLVIKGKGGIPPEPTEPIVSDAILVNGKLTNPESQIQSHNIKPIKTDQGDIYPARGVIKTEDGQIILTRYPTDGIDTRTPQNSPNCS